MPDSLMTNVGPTVQTLAAEPTGPGMERHERHQSQVPGPVDRESQRPLVLGTHSRLAAWFNLRPVREIPAHLIDVLIVDEFHVLYAKSAYPPARRIPAPGTPSRTPTWPTTRPSTTTWSS